MCRSTTALFNTAILPNTMYVANMVAMATVYRVNFMGEMRTNISPSPISTILITESQIWCVCVGLNLLSSQMLLYMYLLFG